MSTNSDQPQANEPAPEESFDELTGVYGFFRKYQKLLLYTAGLFTLLTFSITGSLQSLVGGVFSKDIERGSIEVGGVRAQLTSEDYDYGSRIARSFLSLPAGVLLPIQAGDGGDSELAEILAILRRAAILEGFEPSMAEVDKAIEFRREQLQLESAAKLATRSGFSSTQELRVIVAEAMRIGMYQRLQNLASDTSDAEVMRKLLSNQKKAAYKVAVWDAEAKQEEMIAASELSKEELEKWLDEQSEPQQRRMGVFELPRVKLRIAAVLLGEGQFDAEQWQDDVLKDYAASEDELKGLYDDFDKERWNDEEGNPRAFDDEAVQQELMLIAQAQHVMQDLNQKLRARMDAVVKPATDAVAQAQTDFDSANEARSKTLQDKLTKQKVLARAEEDLAAKPDDADLKAAVETAKAESEAAAAADLEEEQRLKQMEAGLDSAKEAEQQARVDFDLAAEFAELTKDKAGFVVKETSELRDAEELADLDELGLELGKWSTANQATGIRTAGALGNGVKTTTKGVILYHVLEADPTPLKPWEELEPLVEEAFYSKKATDEVIEKNRAIQEVILRLAKEQMPEFVKEKADGRQARIDEELADWEKGVNEEIAKAEQNLKIAGLGERAKKAWEQNLKSKQGELAGKQARIKSIEMTVDRDIENEVKAEALKHYGAVIEAAAKEVGYDLVELGPMPQSLSSRPRFDDNYDKVTKYVYRMHNELEAGVATGPIYQNRMSTVIVCTEVLPLEAEDVTRREFEVLRNMGRFDFADLQFDAMLRASFTQEALAERYKLEKPVGELSAPQQP